MEDNLVWQPDLTAVRKTFSRIGFSFFFLIIITVGLQMVLVAVAVIIDEALMDVSWFLWTLNMLPYLVTVPLFWHSVKKIPSFVPGSYKMGARPFVIFLIMSISILYIGSILGTLISSAVEAATGLEFADQVQELVLGTDLLLNLLFVVILAPVVEELLFRKLLLDRIAIFGEGTAVLFSGLLFGLFHGNFYQFFYAFGLGAMLAYVYLKTGRLRYPVALHMIINFLGSIVAPAILLQLDLEALDAAADSPEYMALINESLPQLLVAGLYIIALIGLTIAGSVLLIIRRKTFMLNKGAVMLPREKRFSIVWLNAGTLFFVAACLVMFALSLFPIIS